MLQNTQVETVKRLLAGGMSQREVSRLTGISRDTIRRIFKGQWHERCPSFFVATDTLPRNLGRCPECGARVLLPCLACQLRQQSRQRSPRIDNPVRHVGRTHTAGVGSPAFGGWAVTRRKTGC
jgi:hypothetical protein